MENLHKTARDYYNAGTEKTKMEAQSLFKMMDTNGDGKVNLLEFKNYINGDENLTKKYFDVVDIDRSGDLDFPEAVTFYYLLTVGRPECDNCSAVLLDVYFTCVKCFPNSNDSFDLCYSCYKSPDRNHEHDSFSKINSLLPKDGNSIDAPEYQSKLEGLSDGLQMAANTITIWNAADKIYQFVTQPTSSSSELPSQLPDVSSELPSQLPVLSEAFPDRLSQLPDVSPQLPDVSEEDAWDDLAECCECLAECSLM